VEGWEDAARPLDKLGSSARSSRASRGATEVRGDFYGHFGDGCVHTRCNFDLKSESGIAKFGRFSTMPRTLSRRMAAPFSGEHGDGQSRGALLEKMFGPS
jgi:FAD/FMN-containing dehydrogenase